MPVRAPVRAPVCPSSCFCPSAHLLPVYLSACLFFCRLSVVIVIPCPIPVHSRTDLPHHHHYHRHRHHHYHRHRHLVLEHPILPYCTRLAYFSSPSFSSVSLSLSALYMYHNPLPISRLLEYTTNSHTRPLCTADLHRGKRLQVYTTKTPRRTAPHRTAPHRLYACMPICMHSSSAAQRRGIKTRKNLGTYVGRRVSE